MDISCFYKNINFSGEKIRLSSSFKKNEKHKKVSTQMLQFDRFGDSIDMKSSSS